MGVLDEKKAYEVMQINPGASKDEISKRYGILARKFRTIDKDEKGYTIEDITRAYNLLMGITYLDEKEEARQKSLRENPPFLSRILKVDPIKLENFFHYYKIHIIISLVAAVFLFFMIKGCVNQVQYDFCLVLFGEVYIESDQKVADFIQDEMSVPSIPSVQVLQSFESDTQYQYAMQMKLMAMLAAKEIDVLITNESVFESHAAQGMYMPLDDMVDILGFSNHRYVKCAEIIEQPDDGEPVMGQEKIYGIAISDSEFIKENGIFGENLIAAVIANTTRKDKAIDFMKLLK